MAQYFQLGSDKIQYANVKCSTMYYVRVTNSGMELLCLNNDESIINLTNDTYKHPVN